MANKVEEFMANNNITCNSTLRDKGWLRVRNNQVNNIRPMVGEGFSDYLIRNIAQIDMTIIRNKPGLLDLWSEGNASAILISDVTIVVQNIKTSLNCLKTHNVSIMLIEKNRESNRSRRLGWEPLFYCNFKFLSEKRNCQASIHLWQNPNSN